MTEIASLIRPRNNMVALVGHSMLAQVIEQTYSGTANRVVLFHSLMPFHLGAKTRGRFIFPESCRFAVASATSTDIVSTVLTNAAAPSGFGVGKTQLQAAVACGAATAFILAEHNDRFNGLTLATTIANYITMLDALTGAGKLCLVSTDIPTGNVTDATRLLSGIQLAYHLGFRDWVLNVMPGLYPGMAYPLDNWIGMEDPAPAATASSILVPAAVDAVHPSCFGGHQMALPAIDLTAAIVPRASPRIGMRGDVFDAVNNPNGNLLGAKGYGFDAGVAWSGTAGGITYAGTRSVAWDQIGPNSALQAGTFTITGAVVTTSTGSWAQYRIQGTAGASGGNISIGPSGLSLGNLLLGDLIAAYGEFEIDANGTGLGSLGLRLLCSLPASGAFPGGESNLVTLGEADGSTKAWDGILSQGMYQGTWNGDLCCPISGAEMAVTAAMIARVVPSATVDFTFRARRLAVRKGAYR